MARIILAAMSVALCAALVWLFIATRQNSALQLENASQARTIAALTTQAAQAREAADVAKATARREAAQAAEYNALRNSLLNGDDDAETPDWFIDYIDRLLGRM